MPAALLLLAALALPGVMSAQQFEHVDSLYFTRPFGAPDPLPQVLAIGSTGANFLFTTASSTSSGGSWLSTSPTGVNCCVTPRGIRVIVTTGAAMAAGTYTGQVVFSSSGVTSLTVQVTLVIQPVDATFFDNTPGQVSFSMALHGHPPSQVLQIRNGGAGTLNWSLTTSTFDGGNWLTASVTSGTAPSVITIGIATASLPNAGATPGTFSGQLLLQTPGGASIVSVPIGLTVSADAMAQVNALSFTKPFGGADPLPQTVTMASQGAVFLSTVTSYTANGSSSGTWLATSPAGVNCCDSPRAITVTPTPVVTLAAGTYTGQVLIDNGVQIMVIPVYLTIGAPTSAFFDNIAGQLSFFVQTGATVAPPSQLLQIRNAGTGTLSWTLTPTVFDSGNWLTVSETSDTAPSQISVAILPASLPGGALTAGVFTANLLFQGAGISVTVPITVEVGPSFQQVQGISFVMAQTGADPLPQNVTIASTGTDFLTTVIYHTATGGSWLSVTPSGVNCCVTPRTLEVSVTAGPTLAAGTYTGEIVVYRGTTSLTIPVTLTVTTPITPSFDNLPGELTFSMQPSSPPQTPSTQVFQIRNAGSGTLNWTLTPVTFDGGNWLTVSASTGTAPELVTVGIVPAKLPNGGLVAGVFTGQLLLQSGQTSVTIPVSVDVDTGAFGQLNGINFTMLQAGANPLPQVVTVTSNGASFLFSARAATATGGNWLTLSRSGTNCCTTSVPITVSINTAPTMPAGIYTGQISFYSGSISQTVPVTLTVAPANTPFFDNTPGALDYSLVTHAGNPPSQSVQIRNGGTGTLSWTSQPFTFDGGNWLTVSAASGTAPSQVTIGIVTAQLPNAGLVAGLFTGQVLFLSGSSSVTVPVSVVVGGDGFAQVNGIAFTMPLAGVNPLPQLLTANSIGNSFLYTVTSATATGGSWLTVSPTGVNCCTTPDVMTVTVSAPPTMAAGTYTGEVIMTGSSSAIVVPVTLTVAPPTAPFFDNVQGAMSFFAATNATPPSQTMAIQDEGAFGLNWTLTPMTSDNGNWLIPSATSGTAPSNVSVSINIQNLPNQGLVAGTFTGQLLYQSANSSVTVPVSVQLGPNLFTQAAGLNFSMPFGGSNPLSQTLNVSSSGAGFLYTGSSSSGNGGNWLSITPVGINCCTTPDTITFHVAGAPGNVQVPAGIHLAQAVFNARSFAMVVPVTLGVSGTPTLGITKTHTGGFVSGQNGTYTVTVTNLSGSGVGATNGTITVTDNVPTGMTLVSMAGTGWTCPGLQPNTCTRSDSLASGQSYPTITVTVNVTATSQSSLTNSVTVSGGGATSSATATDPTNLVTKCDLDQSGSASVVDAQAILNQMLGLAQALNDLNLDGVVNVADLQLVINTILGNGCFAH